MKVVSVTWQDSTSYGRWADEESHKKNVMTTVKTVGILVKSDKKKVAVALSVTDAKDMSDVMNIPRGCVRNITVMGKIDRPKKEKEKK